MSIDKISGLIRQALHGNRPSTVQLLETMLDMQREIEELRPLVKAHDTTQGMFADRLRKLEGEPLPEPTKTVCERCHDTGWTVHYSADGRYNRQVPCPECTKPICGTCGVAGAHAPDCVEWLRTAGDALPEQTKPSWGDAMDMISNLKTVLNMADEVIQYGTSKSDAAKDCIRIALTDIDSFTADPDCQPEQEHGFDRSASHNEDRYVCICGDPDCGGEQEQQEGWFRYEYEELIATLESAGITPDTSPDELAAMARLGKLRARGLELLADLESGDYHAGHLAGWMRELLLGEKG